MNPLFDPSSASGRHAKRFVAVCEDEDSHDAPESRCWLEGRHANGMQTELQQKIRPAKTL